MPTDPLDVRCPVCRVPPGDACLDVHTGGPLAGAPHGRRFEAARGTDDPDPGQTPAIYAPWTDEQVEQLNRFQRLSVMHPFTCANVMHNVSVELVATTEGWVCPNAPCEYTQNWAHAGMADQDFMDRQEHFISNLRTRAKDFGASVGSPIKAQPDGAVIHASDRYQPMPPPRTGVLQVSEVTSYDVVQVSMHGALWPAFRLWIEGRGLYLTPWDSEEEGDLPQFSIGIGDALMRRSSTDG